MSSPMAMCSAAIAIEDEIRPESAEAITQLHRLGVRVAMITGDSQALATADVGIAIGAGTLAPWGIDLSMAVGAVAMSASTIIVAANAQLLRRLRLREPAMAESKPVPQPAQLITMAKSSTSMLAE